MDEQLNDERFIKNVEDLIDPAEVQNLFFFQNFRKLMPNSLFRRILDRTSRKVPYMGFVIEPYSLFLFFRLKDIERAKAMLPERYELTRAKIFDDEEPDYFMGIGNLNTRASTFWGVRVEMYLIARDRETGLLSWIFIDILSNTIIALPSVGIAGPNSREAIFTTTSRGEVHLDVAEDSTGRRLALKGSIKGGKLRPLDQDIWLMGNTSIAHSNDLSGKEDYPFSVIFDPSEVVEALDIPVGDIDLRVNSLFPGLAHPELCKVLCFPWAQHYIADSPGCSTHVKNRQDMIEKYLRIDKLSKMKTYSTRGIRRLFYLWMAISNAGLIALLIVILRGG